MGSDVIFDSPYLDRYLRFGWYMDIIMLLILGDASLTFGPDLSGFGWLRLHIWWWMIWGYPIFRSTIHLCHIGAYFPFGWVLLIFMESHDPHHSWDAWRVDSTLLSYHDPPSWVFFGPSRSTHIFRHLDIIMLLLSRDVSLMFRFDSAMDLGNGNHTFDDGWFDVVHFSAYSILGHISF